MPRVPFHVEDLEHYGAWLSPDGYYTLASYGHEGSAQEIIAANGWKIPWGDTGHDIMFDKGYYRVVFEDGDVLFEYGVLQRLNPELIVEAMSNVPSRPFFISASWTPETGASQSEGNRYKNLSDFKAKTGTGATDKDLLRSKVDPDLGFGKGQEQHEEEPAFSAYAKAWIDRHCKFARK